MAGWAACMHGTLGPHERVSQAEHDLWARATTRLIGRAVAHVWWPCIMQLIAIAHRAWMCTGRQLHAMLDTSAVAAGLVSAPSIRCHGNMQHVLQMGMCMSVAGRAASEELYNSLLFMLRSACQPGLMLSNGQWTLTAKRMNRPFTLHACLAGDRHRGKPAAKRDHLPTRWSVHRRQWHLGASFNPSWEMGGSWVADGVWGVGWVAVPATRIT